MPAITDPPCAHPNCPNPVVVGLSVLLPTAASWWCVEHLQEAERYLHRIEASLRALLETGVLDLDVLDGDGPPARARQIHPDTGTGPGHKSNRARLESAAASYLQGGAKAVMADCQVSRSQAFRLIQLARQEGLLPPDGKD